MEYLTCDRNKVTATFTTDSNLSVFRIQCHGMLISTQQKNKQCTNPQLPCPVVCTQPHQAVQQRLALPPQSILAHRPRASSSVEHCPMAQLFLLQLWHKGTSSLPQGAELGPCPQGLGSTYRRLSLRVAMAACRASSFTASQPGGGPFCSSSFTASTAPSMVPTAALYCSSEGG